MESFEFLGGRYNRPEQIMSGPVQAFRAQNAANGRTVFIHRVSTTEAPAEQAALLKLLTTAVVKSPDAKRLVLDFGEESGYWYVVTESEPQCALLREWLQLEIDAITAASRAASGAAAAPTPKQAAPPPTLQPTTDPGEFTRFLQGRPPVTPPTSMASSAMPPAATTPPVPEAQSAPGEFSRIFQTASAQPTTPAAPTVPLPQNVQRPEPGEFTSFFNSPSGDRPKPAAQPIPAETSKEKSPAAPLVSPTPPSPTGPATPPSGEFTRFFNTGLPPVPPKPAAPASTVPPNFERTQRNPYVQRPNTPVPQTASKTEAGEFTRLFSRPDNAKAPGSPQPSQPVSFQQQPVRSDPMGFSTPGSGQPHDISDDLFSNKIDVGQPMPSAESQSSEFTKMFGKVGAAAPLVQPASGVAAPPDKPLLNESPAQHDPFNVTQPLPVMKSETPVTAGQPSPGDSPSEFTMIMRGGYGQNKPAETTAAQTGSGGAGQAAGKPAAPAMPAFGGIKAPAMTPPAMATLGTAHASGGGLNASAGAAGASVGASQIPGANLRIPPPAFQMPAAPKSSSTKKLIIFLVCLGVLALVMILVVLFLLKTQ